MDVYTAFSGKRYRTCSSTICQKFHNNRGGFCKKVRASALALSLIAMQAMMAVKFLTNFPEAT
jgi:hypothetical protein